MEKTIEQAKQIFVLGTIIIVSFSILFLTSNKVFASNDNTGEINIYFMEQQLEFDVTPVIEDGRTLVPFRKLAESIGVYVSWVAQEEKIIAESEELEFIMTVGSKTAYLNDKSIEMDVSPQIIDGRTLIPLRRFSEIFDVIVDYKNGEVYMSLLEELTLEGRTLSGFYTLGYEGRSSWEELFGASYPNVSKDSRAAFFDDIHLGWFEISGEGDLISSGERHGFRRPEGYEDVIEKLSDKKINSNMTIYARQETSEESEGLTEVLNSEIKREKLIDDIIEELMSDEYSGVNLDIEELGSKGNEEDIRRIRQNYVDFVKELVKKLKEDHRLVITVHPPNSAYKGYDYEKLGELADKLVVMAYDYHDRNTPSASAPIDKVEEGIVQLKEKVPADQIVLGVRFPAVKYIKTVKEDENFKEIKISHPYLDSVYELKENEELEKKWSNSSAVSYLEFKDNDGNQNYIYMESTRSLLYKWELIDRYELRGASFWRLGVIPDFVYNQVNEIFVK